MSFDNDDNGLEDLFLQQASQLMEEEEEEKDVNNDDVSNIKLEDADPLDMFYQLSQQQMDDDDDVAKQFQVGGNDDDENDEQEQPTRIMASARKSRFLQERANRRKYRGRPPKGPQPRRPRWWDDPSNPDPDYYWNETWEVKYQNRKLWDQYRNRMKKRKVIYKDEQDVGGAIAVMAKKVKKKKRMKQQRKQRDEDEEGKEDDTTTTTAAIATKQEEDEMEDKDKEQTHDDHDTTTYQDSDDDENDDDEDKIKREQLGDLWTFSQQEHLESQQQRQQDDKPEIDLDAIRNAYNDMTFEDKGYSGPQGPLEFNYSAHRIQKNTTTAQNQQLLLEPEPYPLPPKLPKNVHVKAIGKHISWQYPTRIKNSIGGRQTPSTTNGQFFHRRVLLQVAAMVNDSKMLLTPQEEECLLQGLLQRSTTYPFRICDDTTIHRTLMKERGANWKLFISNKWKTYGGKLFDRRTKKWIKVVEKKNSSSSILRNHVISKLLEDNDDDDDDEQQDTSLDVARIQHNHRNKRQRLLDRYGDGEIVWDYNDEVVADATDEVDATTTNTSSESQDGNNVIVPKEEDDDNDDNNNNSATTDDTTDNVEEEEEEDATPTTNTSSCESQDENNVIVTKDEDDIDINNNNSATTNDTTDNVEGKEEEDSQQQRHNTNQNSTTSICETVMSSSSSSSSGSSNHSNTGKVNDDEGISILDNVIKAKQEEDNRQDYEDDNNNPTVVCETLPSTSNSNNHSTTMATKTTTGSAVNEGEISIIKLEQEEEEMEKSSSVTNTTDGAILLDQQQVHPPSFDSSTSERCPTVDENDNNNNNEKKDNVATTKNEEAGAEEGTRCVSDDGVEESLQKHQDIQEQDDEKNGVGNKKNKDGNHYDNDESSSSSFRLSSPPQEILNYQIRQGTIPPIPPFPLHVYGCAFSNKVDIWRDATYARSMDDETIRAILSILLRRLERAKRLKEQGQREETTSMSSSAEVQEAEEQLELFVRTLERLNRSDPIMFHHQNGIHVRSVPLTPYKEAIQYRQHVLANNTNKSSKDAAWEISVGFEQHMLHRGLQFFPGLFLTDAIAHVAKELPPSAAERLARPIQRDDEESPFDIIRETLQHMEDEAMLKMNDSDIFDDEKQMNVSIVEHFFVGAVTKLKDAANRSKEPEGVETLENTVWRLAFLSGCLLLASGNRIGSGAHVLPSSLGEDDDNYYDNDMEEDDHRKSIFDSDYDDDDDDDDNDKDDDVAHNKKRKRRQRRRQIPHHEIRKASPKFSELLDQTRWTLQDLMERTMLEESQFFKKWSWYMARFLEWSEVVALLMGPKRNVDDVSTTQKCKGVRQDHAKYVLAYCRDDASSSCLRDTADLIKRKDIPKEVLLDLLVLRLANAPNDIQNWRNFIGTIGPVGVVVASSSSKKGHDGAGGVSASSSSSCPDDDDESIYLQPGLSMDHDSRQSQEWWGTKHRFILSDLLWVDLNNCSLLHKDVSKTNAFVAFEKALKTTATAAPNEKTQQHHDLLENTTSKEESRRSKEVNGNNRQEHKEESNKDNTKKDETTVGDWLPSIDDDLLEDYRVGVTGGGAETLKDLREKDRRRRFDSKLPRRAAQSSNKTKSVIAKYANKLQVMKDDDNIDSNLEVFCYKILLWCHLEGPVHQNVRGGIFHLVQEWHSKKKTNMKKKRKDKVDSDDVDDGIQTGIEEDGSDEWKCLTWLMRRTGLNLVPILLKTNDERHNKQKKMQKVPQEEVCLEHGLRLYGQDFEKICHAFDCFVEEREVRDLYDSMVKRRLIRRVV